MSAFIVAWYPFISSFILLKLCLNINLVLSMTPSIKSIICEMVNFKFPYDLSENPKIVFKWLLTDASKYLYIKLHSYDHYQTRSMCKTTFWYVIDAWKRDKPNHILQHGQRTLFFEGDSGAFWAFRENLRKYLVTQSAHITPGFEEALPSHNDAGTLLWVLCDKRD